MKGVSTVLCLIGILLVAACDRSGVEQSQGRDNASASEASATPAQQKKRPKPRPAPEGDKGIDALKLAGVRFDFPHAVRYDILDVGSDGITRHRVLIELLGGDFDSTVAQFEASLSSAGYALAKESSKGKQIRKTYSSAGKPNFGVLIQPMGSGPALRNADAVGSIHIMWKR